MVGSDAHHPSGAAGSRFPGSHYTWVKMARPSLEGLRLALLDGGGFSIRRSDAQKTLNPFSLPTHCIEAIEISDARYMGRGESARLAFSPWLNALVGGRGTGKSTVVHALRLAARREPELKRLDERSGPRSTFERFNRVPSKRMDEGGLTSATHIQWTVMRDGVKHRVHWRQDGTGTAVEESPDNGGWRASAVQSVTPGRFPIRIFSQGQIAELAGKNQQALLRVIDEAAGVAALQEDLDEARNAFYASRARIRELDVKLGKRTDLVVGFQDVERKLKRFEDAGHTEILIAYRHRSRQRREVDRHFDVAANTAARIEGVAAELQPDDLPEGLFDEGAEDDQQAAATIATLAAEVHAAARAMRNTAQVLREAIETQREALEKTTWQAAVDRTAGDYERLVETLGAEGISDPSEYGRLVQERQGLENETKRLESMQEDRDELYQLSRSQLDEVMTARRAVSDARDRFLADTLAQNRFVRVRNRTYGDDPRGIERSLREILAVLDDRFQDDILVMEDGRPARGHVANLIEDLPGDSKARRSELETRIEHLKQHVVDACAGRGDFGGHFNNFLARESGRKPELLDRLLTWFPEDGLSVEYSRRGDGRDFQPIAQASAGQRSAAMLAFLLAHGEEHEDRRLQGSGASGPAAIRHRSEERRVG